MTANPVNKRGLAILKALLLFVVTLACTAAAAQTGRIALVGGTLIDGSGAQAVRNSIVLIDGDRIASVGVIGRLAIPAGYQLVSTEGMTVMPGLWDPHVHMLYSDHPDLNYWLKTYADQFESVTMPASAKQFLMAGVTSVRDLAAPTADIMAVRDKINKGEIPGPTVYAAGAALSPAVGELPPHFQAYTNTENAVQETGMLIAAGADFINVFNATQGTLGEFKAIVQTAHAAGIRVAAHGRSDAEIRMALAAGVDELQHIGTDTPQYPEDIIDMIRSRIQGGTPLYWCPTVGVDLNANAIAAEPEFLDDPRNFVGLTEAMELDVRQAIAQAEFATRTPAVIDTMKRKLQQLNELGVILVSGSDMGTFGHPAASATWRDLEAWVFELGMDPLTAIKWATSDAADYMGVGDQVGTVRAGKLADVIAVRGSPLRNFSVLDNPLIVIKHGIRYK